MPILLLKSHLKPSFYSSQAESFGSLTLETGPVYSLFIDIPMSNPQEICALSRIFRRFQYHFFLLPHVFPFPRIVGFHAFTHSSHLLRVFQVFKKTSVMIPAGFYLYVIALSFDSEGGYASLNYTITLPKRGIY